jgi:hypothetical protein
VPVRTFREKPGIPPDVDPSSPFADFKMVFIARREQLMKRIRGLSHPAFHDSLDFVFLVLFAVRVFSGFGCGRSQR